MPSVRVLAYFAAVEEANEEGKEPKKRRNDKDNACAMPSRKEKVKKNQTGAEPFVYNRKRG